MKFVIVGAGAIGRLFGAFLSRGGQEVVFIETRDEVVHAINQRGIGLMEFSKDDPHGLLFYPAQAVTDPARIKDCDALLLTVKSYDTLSAIKSVAHLVGDTTPVLSLQTGIGNLEIMERVVARQNIVGGFTYMAAASLGPGDVRHGGAGKTYIGELDNMPSARIKMLAQVFSSSGIETEVLPGIISSLWCKVIVYSAINPLTAILRVRNGHLLDRLESLDLMRRLLDEGKTVATACSVDLGCSDLHDLLLSTCRNTSNNISSMLQDILNGKQTEIDALNGALCQFAREKNVIAPTHYAVVQLVKLLEKWGYGLDDTR